MCGTIFESSEKNRLKEISITLLRSVSKILRKYKLISFDSKKKVKYLNNSRLIS